MTTSRRSFLARAAATSAAAAAAGASAGWFKLDWAAVRDARDYADAAMGQAAPPAFRTLTPEDAADLAAMAARIMPTTDTPGATEAGVIYFMDRAIGEGPAKGRELMRQATADLRARAARRKPGTTSFAALPASDQDAILEEIEKSDFFVSVRFLTMAGMFGDPSHGGNRNQVGWKLIGFEHRPSYAPPFGYYDAEAAKER